MTWGESDNEGWVREERAEEMWREGAQAMREMLARFVEQGGHPAIARSMRMNWRPSWGQDPGQPAAVAHDAWTAGEVNRVASEDILLAAAKAG